MVRITGVNRVKVATQKSVGYLYINAVAAASVNGWLRLSYPLYS